MDFSSLVNFGCWLQRSSDLRQDRSRVWLMELARPERSLPKRLRSVFCHILGFIVSSFPLLDRVQLFGFCISKLTCVWFESSSWQFLFYLSVFRHRLKILPLLLPNLGKILSCQLRLSMDVHVLPFSVRHFGCNVGNVDVNTRLS